MNFKSLFYLGRVSSLLNPQSKNLVRPWSIIAFQNISKRSFTCNISAIGSSSSGCCNLRQRLLSIRRSPVVVNELILVVRPLSSSSVVVGSTTTALNVKKRTARKKKTITEEEDPTKASWSVVAHSTAEEYDLESLTAGLEEQGLYQQSGMPEDMNDVLHVAAKYQVGREPREVYFFREGSLVFWNVPELERKSVLKFLQKYESNPYEEKLSFEENEMMEYHYTEHLGKGSNKTRLVSGTILLNSEGSTDLEKYAFSNGMALSVKLAIWEGSLDLYADSIEWITDNMKSGLKITMTRDQVFRKTGELFALRHLINLSSDLLDTPDFYWDRQNLENLFQKTCNHLNIAKRTKVMNEKLNHCCELMELISNHLNDKHHVRLEWMIIVLIMVEVVFEFIHYGERIFS